MAGYEECNFRAKCRSDKSNSNSNLSSELFQSLDYIYDQIPHIKEIGEDAIWSVSSCKSNHGVDKLRDNRLDTYWQSDGIQPHLINIRFPQRQLISHIAFYLNASLDESYTPTEIQLFSGKSLDSVTNLSTLRLIEKNGWLLFNLHPKNVSIKDDQLEIMRNKSQTSIFAKPSTNNIRLPNDVTQAKLIEDRMEDLFEEIENEGTIYPGTDALAALPYLPYTYVLQIAIRMNDQNGRDSHLRQVKLFTLTSINDDMRDVYPFVSDPRTRHANKNIAYAVDVGALFTRKRRCESYLSQITGDKSSIVYEAAPMLHMDSHRRRLKQLNIFSNILDISHLPTLNANSENVKIDRSLLIKPLPKSSNTITAINLNDKKNTKSNKKSKCEKVIEESFMTTTSTSSPSSSTSSFAVNGSTVKFCSVPKMTITSNDTKNDYEVRLSTTDIFPAVQMCRALRIPPEKIDEKLKNTLGKNKPKVFDREWSHSFLRWTSFR
ncbi:hypothetical protein SNEBB_010702 [Seison nebaliae]|nr:hypothetical protein SNEBB_010702 [Seison nebaliae]